MFYSSKWNKCLGDLQLASFPATRLRLDISSEASVTLRHLPGVDREKAVSDCRHPDHKHIVDPIVIFVPRLQYDARLEAVPCVARLRGTLRVGEDVDIITGAELIIGVDRELPSGIDQAPVRPDRKQFTWTQNVGS